MATKVSLYNDKWIEQITYQKSLEEYGESNTKLINSICMYKCKSNTWYCNI